MSEKIFAKGIFFRKPNNDTPEFIKGHLSFKVGEAIEFLKQYETVAGYVNVDLKKSKEGKLYLELNQWKKKEPDEPISRLTDEEIAILNQHRNAQKQPPQESLEDIGF